MAAPAPPASPMLRPDAEIVCFLDGDGSDVPHFLSAIVGPVARGEADFVMGSRLRGHREPGSMTPQQLVAGRLAGVLMRLAYGVRFTDMSPFRAMRVDQVRRLGMSETTYGWNLEMQMRAAAAGLRIREIAVDHRCRRGGVSKVSGNLAAGFKAAWKISTTFLRLACDPARCASGAHGRRPSATMTDDDRRHRSRQMGPAAPQVAEERMAGAEGIEPSHGGIKIRCLTAWLRPTTSRPSY